MTTQQIADVVRVATIGDIDAALTKISLDDRQIPIRVQVDTQMRTDLGRDPQSQGSHRCRRPGADLGAGRYQLFGRSELDQALRPQPRGDAGRRLPIGVALNTASTVSSRWPPRRSCRMRALPRGRRCRGAGGNAARLRNAMLLGLCWCCGLILLFKDVIQPIHHPVLAAARNWRVAVGLIVTQNAMSMPVLIGILMLMASSPKTRSAGRFRHRDEAARHGAGRGHNRGRPQARPSDHHDLDRHVGGHAALGARRRRRRLVPRADGDCGDGGIIVSTVLSLVVVPSFLPDHDDLSRLLGRLFGRFFGAKEQEIEPLANADLTRSSATRSARSRKCRNGSIVWKAACLPRGGQVRRPSKAGGGVIRRRRQANDGRRRIATQSIGLMRVSQ